MHPRPIDLIGAGVLALVLFALVALVVWATAATADPASHGALVGRSLVA